MAGILFMQQQVAEIRTTEEWGWFFACLPPAFLALGICQLVRVLKSNTRGWVVEWDAQRLRIFNESTTAYDGPPEGMHLIDQDGRGYFLYPTRSCMFRLRRGKSSPELEAWLDRAQRA